MVNVRTAKAPRTRRGAKIFLCETWRALRLCGKETTRPLRADDAANAVFDSLDVEIDQEAKVEIGEAKLGQNLREI
jgi:hypothetical protein